MKLKTPINENYAATIVKINALVALENCDNVQHAIIFGNRVVVSKSIKVGDVGIYFPVETQLSVEYLRENNLYRNNILNKDVNQKGYFEENGRIKCVKFRGNRSEGLFMPLSSLMSFAAITEIAQLKEGSVFDQIEGIPVCQKYVVKIQRTEGKPGSKNKYVAKKVSRLVPNQFRFHSDTSMLGKNMHRITPDTILHISNKLHGTSFVTAKILVKKKLSIIEKILKFFKINIVDKDYDVIYSSRKVIKNDDLNKDYQHYYKEDVWADIAKDLSPFLTNGLTVYGEAVGFTKGGAAIQSGYDYGYLPPNLEASYEEEIRYGYGIYIYRITQTNPSGQVYEFSAKQVQEWCDAYGLNAVPEYFYGKAKELVSEFVYDEATNSHNKLNEDAWRSLLLEKLLTSYNMEKDCELCVNKVPAEGIVVRIEGLDYNAYKLKSFRFREHETKQLDKGEIDIESQESQTEEV